MKKLVYSLAVVIMVTELVSCGTQKSVMSEPASAPVVAESTQFGDLVIAMAEEDPVKRQFGTATEMQLQATINVATDAARANLAAAIQTRIIRGVGSFYLRQTSGNLNPNSDDIAKAASEFAEKTNSDFLAISKESVNNAVAIKTERKQRPNGMWEVYVCVEVNMNVAELIKTVTEAIDNTIPQSVKDDINYQKYMFEKDMEKEFEDYTSISK